MNKNYKHYKQSKFIERWDFIVALVLVVLLAVTLILVFAPKTGSEVEIYKNGSLIGSYSLKENRALSVGEMRIDIFEGRVSVAESNCPDKLCVYATPIKQTGSTIICVPNQVVIKISGKSEVEGITG